MPFYRTTVTVERPYSGLTPLGVTRVIVEAETQADSVDDARETAALLAGNLLGDLDHVTAVHVEVR